jgi:pimeloyl-ACP methyl ester carboxylesterase
MEKTFQYQSTNISYNIYGVGDVVVLLHGFGEDSRIFNHQVTFLERHFKVLVPDLPGSGNSDLLQKDDVSIDNYTLLWHLPKSTLRCSPVLV